MSPHRHPLAVVFSFYQLDYTLAELLLHFHNVLLINGNNKTKKPLTFFKLVKVLGSVLRYVNMSTTEIHLSLRKRY